MRDKRSDNIPTTPLVTQHTHTGHHRGPAVATRESSHVGPRGREDVWIRRATDLGCTLTSDGPLLLGTSWGAAPRPRGADGTLTPGVDRRLAPIPYARLAAAGRFRLF